MARKPFPIRLDTNVIDKIEALSKSLGIPKSQIVDVALERYLATLNAYAEMDKAPPKTAKAKPLKVAGKRGPGGIVQIEGVLHDAAVVTGRLKAEAQAMTKPCPILADLKMKPGKLKDAAPRAPSPARSVRGYAIDGSPIYR